MSTKPCHSAYPVFDDEGYALEDGLTKREYFAAVALSGLLANKTITDSSFRTTIAIASVEMADLLILHLNRITDEKSNSEEQPQEEKGTEA